MSNPSQKNLSFRGYLPRLRATSRADISRYITTYIQGKPHIGLALMSNEAQARIKIQPEELMGAVNAGTIVNQKNL